MTDRLIDHWFPVTAVDEACKTPAGSGQNEKAIFTWFASRPIAQARAAVLTSLIAVEGDPTDELVRLVEQAVRSGDDDVLSRIYKTVPDVAGKRPVVLDCFSGRGIIPLEAARIGLRAVGLDNSPVAALASRLLADWSLQDWSNEPDVSFGDDPGDHESQASLFESNGQEPKLLRDLRKVFAEIGRRLLLATGDRYPANPDGSRPWGYLWATTIPCDQCRRRFPLIGSYALRHPYTRTSDPGQHFTLDVDRDAGTWAVSVHDGVPTALPTYRASDGRRGKSGWCPFCSHQHPLTTIKAKGFAGEYEDVVLVAADLPMVEITVGERSSKVERKVFRVMRSEEISAAYSVDLQSLDPIGSLSAAPFEEIAPGNNSTVDATGYGARVWADLMNDRQVFLFAETARVIHDLYDDLNGSDEYRQALLGFAASVVVRRLRRSTKGCRLEPQQGRRPSVVAGDIFARESGIIFNFDWFETGPASGPGTWSSLTKTSLKPVIAHLSGLSGIARPGQFRQGSARSLPYRDGSVDAVVTDPPYYDMINYADVSDLFYVWLRRCLSDAMPDLFGTPGDGIGLQGKSEEIVVKQGRSPEDHRTVDWYESEMSTAFAEMRRVLKDDGVLTVVFGHSDPDAWRRLLGALRTAGFVVTSAWPARTESGNTGVASIKVTVTIGCRVAKDSRPTATAAQVEREIVELIRKRVPKWEVWNLALSDQRMAAYGPAMQVVGRYNRILRPDGTEPDLEHFLTIGRRAVAEAHSFKVDELPLDTFDAHTRFSLFWLRAYGRATVNKGEAVFEAQAAELRIDDLKGSILTESNAGFALNLAAPPPTTSRSPVVHLVRAMAEAWTESGTDGAASVIAAAERDPDDPHLWATVSELVRLHPESTNLSKALTACQRNRSAISSAARRAAATRPQQLTINAGEDA